MRTSEEKLAKLKTYQGELENSKRWRKKWFEDQWRLYRDMYAHRDPLFCDAMDPHDGERVQVNYVNSTLNVIMASTLHRYPKITASARNPESFNNSIVVELALNQQWRTKKWQLPHRAAMLDKLVFGHGWVKTTYQFKQEERELTEAEFEGKFEEEMSALVAVSSQSNRPFPRDEEVRESLDRKGTFTLKDEVQVERVSPWDVYIDPSGKDLETVCWVAQVITEKRRIFVEDERFPKSMRDDMKPGRTLNGGNGVQGNWINTSEESMPEQADSSNNGDFVRYVEFYDLVDGTLSFFLLEGGESFLIDPAPMPYAFGQPFEMLRGTEVPDRFYPMGEVELIADQQRELNKLRTSIINDRKKGKRQYLYKPDNVTQEFIEAMESDAEDVLLPVKANVDFNDVMAELPFQGRVDPQMYDLSALLQNDIFQLSGITDYQRGGGSSSRTATQVAVENDAALARQARQLESLESAMSTTARRALQLMQQFMTEPQILRMANSSQIQVADGANTDLLHRTFLPFGPKEIGGEFDIDIEAGSTRPLNDSTRAQRALQVMNAMTPFLQLQNVDPSQLLVYVLRELGVPNPESWVTQGVDPRGISGEVSGGNLNAPSVAGGVAQVGANIGPEQREGQGEPTPTDSVRGQLEQQFSLAQ